MANILGTDLLNQKKQQVVLVSSVLFLRQGIDNVKMTDVAEACELGVASLYRYFGTKTQLVMEAGTILWKDLGELFENRFYSKEYDKKSGIEQMRELLSIYQSIYKEHSDFLRFINDFDKQMIQDNVKPEQLQEYEQSIFDFYSMGKKAYDKGVEDGTIRSDVSFQEVYYPMTHAMMAMCQKFIQKDILPEDAKVHKEKEIQGLIDMAIFYLQQ